MLAAIVFSAAAVLAADTNTTTGYIVLDAEVVDKRYQPKLFAIGPTRYTVSHHLSTKELIHEIEAGEYFLGHFDYTTGFHQSIYDVYLWGPKPMRFSVKPGQLTNLGKLFMKRRSGHWDISFDAGLHLLSEVCEAQPELIEKSPVIFEGWDSEDRELQLTCKTDL